MEKLRCRNIDVASDGSAALLCFRTNGLNSEHRMSYRVSGWSSRRRRRTDASAGPRIPDAPAIHITNSAAGRQTERWLWVPLETSENAGSKTQAREHQFLYAELGDIIL